MLTGTVLWYDAKKGIGFIKPDESENDVFVHMKALKASGMKDLGEGIRISFDVQTDVETGRKAGANFALLTGEAPRPRPKKKTVKEKFAEAKIKEETPKSDASAFAALGLDEMLVKPLSFLGYTTPTPIQKQAIPAALQGRDIVGLAQTGTGKTAAFLTTIIQKILNEPIEGEHFLCEPRALIIAPTRELVVQIAEDAKNLCKYLNVHVHALIGGEKYDKQLHKMDNQVADIVVATP
jgi:cold shock CspA family protein/superfamily II helicase